MTGVHHDDGVGSSSSSSITEMTPLARSGPLHATDRSSTTTRRRRPASSRRSSSSFGLTTMAAATLLLLTPSSRSRSRISSSSSSLLPVADGYSPPTMRLKARDLLETARSLREARHAAQQQQSSSFVDGNGNESRDVQKRREEVADIGIRSGDLYSELFAGPASVASVRASLGSTGAAASTTTTSWTEALFDEAEQDLLDKNNDGEDDDDDDSDLVARVQAAVPAVTDLQTATGSEILDVELHLQMEAARRRAAKGSGSLGAFVETHLDDATSIEKMAMKAVPVQLPRPAAVAGVAAAVPTTERQQAEAEEPVEVLTKKSKTNNKLKADATKPDVKTAVRKTLPKSKRTTDSSKRKTTTTTLAKKSKVTTRSAAETKSFTKSVSYLMSTRQKAKSKVAAETARVTHEEELELARIIQRGAELHRIKTDFETTHSRDITRQEWTEMAGLESPRELRRLVSNYRSAKNKLVTANMGLVYAVVKSKHAHRIGATGVSQEELVQEGSLGLLRAAELFDPKRGLRFSTYATIWIKGVLSNSRVDETIALPAREKSKFNKIQRAAADLVRERGNDGDDGYRPKLKDVASRSGMDVAEVERVTAKMERTQKLLSLDYTYETTSRSGNDSSSNQSLMVNDRAMQVDADLIERLQVRADVIAALARNLDKREARLMRLRYGLRDGVSRSLTECAEAMGISREKARVLALGCLKKLREADDADSLQEYLLTVA